MIYVYPDGYGGTIQVDDGTGHREAQLAGADYVEMLQVPAPSPDEQVLIFAGAM